MGHNLLELGLVHSEVFFEVFNLLQEILRQIVHRTWWGEWLASHDQARDKEQQLTLAGRRVLRTESDHDECIGCFILTR